MELGTDRIVVITNGMMSRNDNGIILRAFLRTYTLLNDLFARVDWATKHPDIFMTKEDLALTLRSIGVRRGIRLTKLKVGFYINLGAFLQVTKVIIRDWAEGENMVPCSLGLWSSAVGARRRGWIIRRGYCVGDIFFVASGGTDLGVFAKPTNEDEFGHVG